jgi:hypothetical protein
MREACSSVSLIDVLYQVTSAPKSTAFVGYHFAFWVIWEDLNRCFAHIDDEELLADWQVGHQVVESFPGSNRLVVLCVRRRSKNKQMPHNLKKSRNVAAFSVP